MRQIIFRWKECEMNKLKYNAAHFNQANTLDKLTKWGTRKQIIIRVRMQFANIYKKVEVLNRGIATKPRNA
jgi:hypothetical protein